MHMEEAKSRITRVDPSLVKDNQVLALSVNRQDVDRSVHFIREYGLLMPPVIGQMQDGSCKVLSGERELMALREMGVRTTEAVMVLAGAQEEMDKLSLLLSTLKQAPNPLSEGMFVVQILQAGHYTQAQVGDLLGKSVSWVNKRFTLVTRLHPAVRDLITQRQLCTHSAQNIAKLPESVQLGFSQKVLLDGLPKSAVEILVSNYNKEGCPPALQTQILEAPRHALQMLAENAVVKIKVAAPITPLPAELNALRNNLTLLLRCIRDAEMHFARLDPSSKTSMVSLFHTCKERCARFSALLGSYLPFSPGKLESGVTVNGH